jgi:hypothetical protein
VDQKKNKNQIQKNTNSTEAKLWQAVSEEEQNALKGGWPALKWPYGSI